MATEVFNLEVQIKTTPALQGLRSLNRELDATKRKAGEIGKQNGLGTLKRSVDGVSASFKGLGGILAGLGIAKLTTATITAIAEYERLQVVLETVTGSASGAAAAIKTIDAASRSTGIAQGALADSFIKLEAAGLKPTLEQLQLFGDVASVTTDQLGSLQAITDLYARTTAGGLGLEEVNRLADRGIPVFDILNKRLGISRLQISELGKTADGAKLILRNLEAGFKDAFGGASAKQLNTLSGQTSLFRQNLTALATGAGTAGLTDGFTDLTKALNELLVAIRPVTNALGAGIGGAISGSVAAIKGIISDFTELAVAAGVVVVAFGALKGALSVIALNRNPIKFLISDLAATGEIVTGLGLKGQKTKLIFQQVGVSFGNFGKILKDVNGGAIKGGVAALPAVFASIKAAIASSSLGQFVGLAFRLVSLINPWVRGFTVLVGLLAVFRNTTLKAGDATATIGEVISFGYNKIIDSITGVVSKVKEFFSLMVGFVPPTWISTISKGFSNLVDIITPTSVVKQIDTDRKAKEETDKESARLAQRAADAKLMEADAVKQIAADQQLLNDITTGRVATVKNIILSLGQETRLLGQSAEEAEKLSKIYEVQSSIRQRLEQAGKSEAEIQKQIRLSTEETAKITGAVAAKYAEQRKLQFNELVRNTNFEITLLSKGSNEIEKQTKLREILVSQGRETVATEKERAAILAEITRGQDARINASLNSTLEGLNKETAQLKLNNREREIAIALQDAATAAGLKGADQLSQVRKDEIRGAIQNRQQTVVDVEAQRQIDSLKEQAKLTKILNNEARNRKRTEEELYKSIDPDGKGKNITDKQKSELNNLLKTIELNEQLIEINNKVNDQFRTLGDAVTKAILGGTDAVRQLKLELIKLAALEAFKTFARGSRTGSTGSFLGGLIDGISGARAQGGPVNAGGTYLVGEKGPELVKFGQAGYVVPNMDAQTRVSSRSGNVVVQVNPTFQNNGNINSTEDLNGLMAQWGEGVARQTEKFVREQFGPSGLAYN